MSLGDQYVSDFVKNQGGGLIAPLSLVLCEDCNLLQLEHTVRRELIYRQYWYMSGINKTMKAALKDVVDSARRFVTVKAGDIVVDIGCNDGTLLQNYERDLTRVGFEPATNLVENAKKVTHLIVNDFFSAENYFRLVREKARIVTAIAMFYDLDEPNSFVKDVKTILAEDGVFLIQMNYLGDMIERSTFDNIGHEHLEYYSLTNLKPLLERNGLMPFDVEFNEINGGSFRIYIQHQGGQYSTSERISETLQKEAVSLSTLAYADFARQTERIKRTLLNFITAERAKGKTIYVYGASNRGNTILQYFGLDHTVITAAAERNPNKWGFKTIGTGIPIISEEEARSQKPDYFLILPYAALSEFLGREKEYFASGGKFIVPLPVPRLISSDAVTPLIGDKITKGS